MPADGGAAAVTVTAARDCSWSVQSQAPWLKLATTAGQGTATIAVTAESNAQAAARTGALVVNDQRLDITQDGRGCTIALQGSTQMVAAAGGRSTLQITTLSGCPWTVTASAPWVAPLTAAGSGSATVAYDVSANSSSEREASIAVGTQRVIVTQAAAPAAPPCTFTIDPVTRDVAAVGGQVVASVTTQTGCGWTVSTDGAFIALITTGGTGSGDVRFAVAGNTSTIVRQATVTIAGRVLAVTQQGIACSFTITPPSQAIVAAGGSGVVQVTTLPPCTWTASSNAGWTILAAAGGTGSGQVSYQVQPNTDTSPRTAIVTVAGQPHSVQQAGVPPPPCTFDLNPLSRTFTAAGATATVRVTTAAGCAWTAAGTMPWITVAPASASGSGTADVTYTVAANTSTTAGRTGAVTIGGQTHSVTQDAAEPPCTYVLTPTERTIDPAGGTASVRVTTGPTCAWTAVSSASFVTVTTPSGIGTADIFYLVSPGPPTTNRMATITVKDQVHTINQRRTN